MEGIAGPGTGSGIEGQSRRRAWPVGSALIVILLLLALPSQAAKWSRRYIASLDDSAFAAVETTKDGKKVRHLPHHDHTGALDLPHLLSALSRLNQVKWGDPKNREVAEAHLQEHVRAYREAKIAQSRVTFPLDLNRASVQELQALPFIGPKRASAIASFRMKHGRFRSVEELHQVPGIGPTLFGIVKDLVTVTP